MPRVRREIREEVGRRLAELYGEGPVPPAELRSLARLHKVDPKTIRRWKQAALEGFRPLGRPVVHDGAAMMSVLRGVRRLLRDYGWSLGEGRCLVLLPGVARSLLREALRRWKARHRSRERDRWRRLRRSTEVSVRDAVWVLDAAELGRDEAGEKVHGVVVRDVATTRVRAASVGGKVTAEDVLALLVLAWRRTGTLPLLLLTDNGSQMVAEVVRSFLRSMRIVHLCNLPRTPQHNAFAERTIGTVKRESGLGSRTRVRDAEDAARRMAEAIERTERGWPRLSRGGKTAVALDRDLDAAEDAVDRAALYEAVRSATEEAAQRHENGRARRKAVRKAILATAEEYGVLTRTGGDGGETACGGK